MRLKEVGVGLGKIVGTVALGTVGVAAGIIEGVGAAGKVEFVEDLSHDLKTASFDTVRKIWGGEPKGDSIKVGERVNRMNARNANEIIKEIDRKLNDTTGKYTEEQKELFREQRDKLEALI